MKERIFPATEITDLDPHRPTTNSSG